MGTDGNPSVPKSFSEELIEAVYTLSKQCDMSPFDILKQDIDNFILLANYFINLGKTTEKEAIKQPQKDDGFWDF